MPEVGWRALAPEASAEVGGFRYVAPMRTRRILWPLAVLVAAGVAGCGGSVSVGNDVSQAEAEKQAATVIAEDVGVPVSEVPPIKCPGDLKAEVGTVMNCDFGPVDGQMGTAKLTVTSVEGSKVGFDVSTSAN